LPRSRVPVTFVDYSNLLLTYGNRGTTNAVVCVCYDWVVMYLDWLKSVMLWLMFDPSKKKTNWSLEHWNSRWPKGIRLQIISNNYTCFIFNSHL